MLDFILVRIWSKWNESEVKKKFPHTRTFAHFRSFQRQSKTLPQGFSKFWFSKFLSRFFESDFPKILPKISKFAKIFKNTHFWEKTEKSEIVEMIQWKICQRNDSVSWGLLEIKQKQHVNPIYTHKWKSDNVLVVAALLITLRISSIFEKNTASHNNYSVCGCRERSERAGQAVRRAKG